MKNKFVSLNIYKKNLLIVKEWDIYIIYIQVILKYDILIESRWYIILKFNYLSNVLQMLIWENCLYCENIKIYGCPLLSQNIHPRPRNQKEKSIEKGRKTRGNSSFWSAELTHLSPPQRSQLKRKEWHNRYYRKVNV